MSQLTMQELIERMQRAAADLTEMGFPVHVDVKMQEESTHVNVVYRPHSHMLLLEMLAGFAKARAKSAKFRNPSRN